MDLDWTDDWLSATHGHWDVLSDSSDDDQDILLDVLPPTAQEDDDADAFAPCHFWAMHVWRRHEGYRSAFSFPRAKTNVQPTTSDCMLTLLNRKHADGSAITFASTAPFPSPETAQVDPSSTEVTTFVCPWGRSKSAAEDAQDAATDKDETSSSSDDSEDSDDDDVLARMVAAAQQARSCPKEKRQEAPVPPVREVAPVITDHHATYYKLCGRGARCGLRRENRCDKAHALVEWSPTCKQGNKCRRKGRCPFWHKDVESIERHLWRMCWALKDNFFYHRHEFALAYGIPEEWNSKRGGTKSSS